MTDYSKSYTLRGKYLEEFLALLAYEVKQREDREKKLLSITTPTDPAGHAEKLTEASSMVDYYNHINDTLIRLSERTPPSLTGADVESAIYNYRKKELRSEPATTLLGKDLPKISDGALHVIKPGKDEDLQFTALCIREDLLTYFVELHAIQEGKLDEFICQDILALDTFDPTYCTGGKINKEKLESKLIDIEIHSQPKSYVGGYVRSLEDFACRPIKAGLRDVIYQAHIDVERAALFSFVKRTHPGMGEHTCRAKCNELAQELAKEWEIDLASLQQGLAL